MRERDATIYARHSRWSEPGQFGADLAALPADPTALPEIIGGIVLHPLFAPTTPKGKPGPELRRVADIIEAIISRDGRPMDQPREPENRVLGTCRTHALLACAVLRQHKCPARLRVGFADYFTPGFAEDHWICEYRDGHIWRRLDAELTANVRQHCSVSFPSADVPPNRFLTAGSAWIKLRHGERDPSRFGVSVLGYRVNGLSRAASCAISPPSTRKR
jgi:hypothetical protein